MTILYEHQDGPIMAFSAEAKTEARARTMLLEALVRLGGAYHMLGDVQCHERVTGFPCYGFTCEMTAAKEAEE